jgi:hypothetical protein
MGKPHKIAIVRRSIDHDEVMAMLRRGDGALEVREFGGLVFLGVGAFDARDAEVGRQRKIELSPSGPSAAALDIAGQGSLPTIEVDRCNALAGFQQGDGDVHRDRGLSGTALLVSDHDYVRRQAQLMYGRGKHGCASNHRYYGAC